MQTDILKHTHIYNALFVEIMLRIQQTITFSIITIVLCPMLPLLLYMNNYYLKQMQVFIQRLKFMCSKVFSLQGM